MLKGVLISNQSVVVIAGGAVKTIGATTTIEIQIIHIMDILVSLGECPSINMTGRWINFYVSL